MKTKLIINYLIIAILVIILGMLLFRIYKTVTKTNEKSENYFVDSDGINRTKNPFEDIQDLVKEITGDRPKMCFPNYKTSQDSREYEAKFYKNINHLITDAVMKCVAKQDFMNMTRIYLLLPELFKMESKGSYQFIAYGTDKKVIPREKYASSVIEYVEIISPDGKKMTNNDIINFLRQINRPPLNLDPYYVTDSIGPGGKPVKVAMNPTRPPVSPTPKPGSCKDGNYCCKSGTCFQPTEEYSVFYKMANDVMKEIPPGTNTLFIPRLFGRIAPYLYAKRNAYVGLIKTIPSKQNDRLPVSPFVCCEDQSDCKMETRSF